MNNNGRPNHIEDYLVSLHTGQWFGWSDPKNKVYANLIIHDDSKIIEFRKSKFVLVEGAKLKIERSDAACIDLDSLDIN